MLSNLTIGNFSASLFLPAADDSRFGVCFRVSVFPLDLIRFRRYACVMSINKKKVSDQEV